MNSQYPSGRIGIAGTGYAWTQYFLFANHGRQSWGFDVGWAITRAGGILGEQASFVAAYDVLVASQMGTNFRRMGNTGSNKYTTIFTEDLLPCMESETEVATARTNLLLAGTILVHLITPDTGIQRRASEDMLWRSEAQWRALVGTGERIIRPDLSDAP
ncbi:MAG: hypothetical protein M3440_05110 [Chloroflexota bacterium]|nr:hypothetical protein [Chloroflexota bacterium]